MICLHFVHFINFVHHVFTGCVYDRKFNKAKVDLFDKLTPPNRNNHRRVTDRNINQGFFPIEIIVLLRYGPMSIGTEILEVCKRPERVAD